MSQNLLARLPQLLPHALAWAAAVEIMGLKTGKPLAVSQKADASDVGVSDTERIRLCLVDAMPAIPNPKLAAAAKEAGLLGPGALGLTLGHAVFILRPYAGERHLLRHELRHVAQTERAGGLAAFLSLYLEQVARLGYAQAPLEIDARQHERRQQPSTP